MVGDPKGKISTRDRTPCPAAHFNHREICVSEGRRHRRRVRRERVGPVMRIRGSINEVEDGQDGCSRIIVTICNGEGLDVVGKLA
jgi:hypothetical protein